MTRSMWHGMFMVAYAERRPTKPGIFLTATPVTHQQYKILLCQEYHIKHYFPVNN